MQNDKSPQETIAEEAEDVETKTKEAEDQARIFVAEEELVSVGIQRLVLDGVCEEEESEENALCQNESVDARDEEADEQSAVPQWIRTSFLPEELEDVAALRESQLLTGSATERACEECGKRRALLQCSDCEQLLCFTCADAIHIVPVLASHGIALLLQQERSDTEQLTHALGTTPHSSPPPPPPPSPSPGQAPSAAALTSPSGFTPATQIEHRMHLPIGTKLFFRVEDCGRWKRELLHGSVVGLDHGVRSSTTTSTTGDALSFYYRVLWLRGVEALVNGFFRATLMLPTPFWPVEIGLFPSQLSAFRAVLTAEKLARAKLRRERVSGRWHEPSQHHQDRHQQDAFPSVETVNEILDETDAILGHEFRTRLTHDDDRAFLQEVGRGEWQFTAWMAHIGRESELREEAAAIQELDEELLTMERNDDAPLSKLAELLLLWSPRGRMRFFLIEQTELLLPEPLQHVHIASIIQQMLFVYVGFAWQRWCQFIKRHRRHQRKQRRQDAAIRLQTWWRKTLRRIEEAKAEQLLKAMASPMGALELYRKRQLCAVKLYAFVSKKYEDKQRRALQVWAAYTKVLAAHGVGGPVVVFPESQGTWHPSHGITSLPRLPRMYAHKKPDGSVAIDDLKLYKQFRANHAGPTESSYWILRHRVLAGVYPVGSPAFRDARRIVARADYTMSILLQEIGMFVCLAEPSELLSHEPNVDASCLVQYQQQRQQQQRVNRKVSSSEQHAPPQSPRAAPCQTPWLFERIVRAKHDALRVELTGAVKLSERHLQLAQSELDEFLSSVPVFDVSSSSNSLLLSDEARAHRETLTNKVTLAQQSVRKAQETLAQLKPLDFVEFPIPKDGVPDDVQALEAFLVHLEDRLRRQERLYVFSMQGHGRTGFVAALLLGRLYGLTATDALDRAQRLHDCQVAMHGVGATQFVSSPHAAPQITMVTQLLARFNDAIYAPVVSENSEQQFVAWRAQQRGQPIDKFVAKDGFMVSDRVDDATQALQQREWRELQRIAKRESQATKLRFVRQRQEQGRREMAKDEAETQPVEAAMPIGSVKAE